MKNQLIKGQRVIINDTRSHVPIDTWNGKEVVVHSEVFFCSKSSLEFVVCELNNHLKPVAVKDLQVI